jgi:hypothetical protein
VNFSVSSVTVDWTALVVSLGLLVVYVAAAVAAARRFGTPGLWAVWFGGIVAGSSFPFLVHGESIAHFDRASMFLHTAALALPMGISAWLIRPHPLPAAAGEHPRPARARSGLLHPHVPGHGGGDLHRERHALSR